MENVVAMRIYAANAGFYHAINRVYAKHFRENPPSRTFVSVAGWPMEFDIEIEAVRRCLTITEMSQPQSRTVTVPLPVQVSAAAKSTSRVMLGRRSCSRVPHMPKSRRKKRRKPGIAD